MSVKHNTPNLSDIFSCFTNSGKWADGSILPKHERESSEGYARRKKGFCNPNVYKYLIESFDMLFAKGVARIGVDGAYPSFINDAGLGMTLSDFLKRVVKLSESLGSCFIVGDTFEDQPATYDEMIEQRTFPFLSYVLPQDVTTLKVDMVGRITQFSYKVTINGQEIERRYCSVTGYSEYNKDGECLKNKPIDDPTMKVVMPVIPVVTSGEPLYSDETPASQTIGLYQQQYNIALTYSLMDENIYSQQYSIFYATGNVDLQNMTLGPNNAMSLPTGTTAGFLTPSGTPLDKMLERVQQNLTMMQKTFANLISSGEVQSGVAKVIDRQVGAYQLIEKANYIESIEYLIYELFQNMMGEPLNDKFKVTYFKEFDLGDIATYISQASDMIGLFDISEEAKNEVRARVLSKFFADDPVKLQEILIAEQSNKLPNSTRTDNFTPLEDELTE